MRMIRECRSVRKSKEKLEAERDRTPTIENIRIIVGDNNFGRGRVTADKNVLIRIRDNWKRRTAVEETREEEEEGRAMMEEETSRAETAQAAVDEPNPGPSRC